MTRRRDRLIARVQQATPIQDADVTTYADPDAKQALFEAIVARPSVEPTAPDRVASAKPRSSRRLVAAVVASLAVGGIGVLAISGMLGSNNRVASPPPAPGPAAALDPGDPADALGGASQCVETYDLQTLTRRSFAFDGTVVDIATTAPSDVESGDPNVAVTFRVEQWFRGGDTAQVTVAMFPPGQVTSVGNTGYRIGDRLLVSGEPRWGGAALDDPIAWPCGFTRRYNPNVAQAWAQVFRTG